MCSTLIAADNNSNLRIRLSSVVYSTDSTFVESIYMHSRSQLGAPQFNPKAKPRGYQPERSIFVVWLGLGSLPLLGRWLVSFSLARFLQHVIAYMFLPPATLCAS